MKLILSFFVCSVLVILKISSSYHYKCQFSNTKSDTLNVPYTYWWASGGPFSGLCGNKYSLVFTGTIVKIDEPLSPVTINDASEQALYTPQNGIVRINNALFNTSPAQKSGKNSGKNYDGEKYFKSDCFNSLNLKEGDKVIVFIYSYEGEYSIPPNSILKVDDFNSPAILSIKKYIQNGQDPLVIKNDMDIWKVYHLDEALKQIIDCRENSN